MPTNILEWLQPRSSVPIPRSRITDSAILALRNLGITPTNADTAVSENLLRLSFMSTDPEYPSAVFGATGYMLRAQESSPLYSMSFDSDSNEFRLSAMSPLRVTDAEADLMNFLGYRLYAKVNGAVSSGSFESQTPSSAVTAWIAPSGSSSTSLVRHSVPIATGLTNRVLDLMQVAIWDSFEESGVRFSQSGCAISW